ncbi:YceI family protein [Pontibacter liquoris]|uniref:YceI family protein n=1 Tax=Pontibacter liquoris TaxID=2905677 RepID=UPI001FA7AEF1|nr:YceI family protein [Pontibacter liquoris]
MMARRITRYSPVRHLQGLLLVLCLLCLAGRAQAQDRYSTKTGHIAFFSEAPLENIAAHNEQVVSLIDTRTGDIAFSVNMKGFQFRKSLMQHHFNENYVESDKYPKATFKGRITNFRAVNLTQDNSYNVQVTGVLMLHGVEKEITTQATLQVQGNKLLGKSTFSVSPQDFNIEIPLLVREHIAKRIDITVDMLYEPYKAK